MRLYAGTTGDFVADATRNNIARRLESAFVEHFRHRPSPAEVRSWEESLARLGLVVNSAKLTDHGIFLEYQLPQNSRRIDALITGLDNDQRENAVIVELKQWQKSEASDAEAMVTTWLGGELRDMLHPSVQAQGYRDYLADMHTAFHEEPDPILLSACAYLHNYRASSDDPIRALKFQDSTSQAPLFDAEQGAELEEFLVARLNRGHGIPILQRIEESKLRPSKKLLDHISAVVDGEPRFVLLDEQRVVFERALAEAKRGFSDLRKSVVLVQGGPGTGKSVLAANLLGKLSRAGLHTQYTTGSKAFTETLRKILGRRATAQLTYSNNYTKSEPNSVDVLICDEAHRIRERSTTRFMKAAQIAAMPPQIDELLNAAKVSVFFIDDLQVVRPGEAGSA
ncbi:MAG TPA: DNA/RNA helicase domain-containing protein, partial [Pyrinomonadaceae bacterium]|nr:DNA/RNA helicase domain-containing protein [Pyrinomonadaceae bacterium]